MNYFQHTRNGLKQKMLLSLLSSSRRRDHSEKLKDKLIKPLCLVHWTECGLWVCVSISMNVRGKATPIWMEFPCLAVPKQRGEQHLVRVLWKTLIEFELMENIREKRLMRFPLSFFQSLDEYHQKSINGMVECTRSGWIDEIIIFWWNLHRFEMIKKR